MLLFCLQMEDWVNKQLKAMLPLANQPDTVKSDLKNLQKDVTNTHTHTHSFSSIIQKDVPRSSQSDTRVNLNLETHLWYSNVLVVQGISLYLHFLKPNM